jgi:outer membrane protein assembly factor BamA
MIVGGYGIDRSEWKDSSLDPSQIGNYVKIARRRVLLPELAYVHDTVVWGSTGPVNGARYRFSYAYSPNLQADRETKEIWNAEFYTVKGDIRQYIKIGRDYSWATRFTAGLSDGPNPQRFFLGGVSNWINRRFENNEIPTDNINDFYFSSFITPFRGGDYFERRGTGNRFFLTNQEFRFPMVKYLILGWPLPIALQNIRGALFTDVGAAWNDEVFKFTERDRDELGNHTGTRRLSDPQVAYGIGTRMNLGFFLLRWDVAWSTDGVDTSKPRYFFSLGAEY